MTRTTQRKSVLVVGGSGLVGQSALQHFAGEAGTEVIVVSRRPPPELGQARFIPLDLADRAAAAATLSALPHITHVVYAALYEKPTLIEGWRDAEQIAVNEAMLRNVLDPLLASAKGLSHVTLLQGTKAYGVHARPMRRQPAREGRDEARDVPNFYWAQEDTLRAAQRDRDWHFTILRPVLILGYSLGSAMNLIPALGVYAAFLRERGEPLHFPGGAPRISQAIDADVLARVIGWAGESPSARNAIFNVTNGDVFAWPYVWPAIADALGMKPGDNVPNRMINYPQERAAEWDALCAKHKLAAPPLKDFVGLSFEYADFQLGVGREKPAAPSLVSTIALQQAGFHEVIDTEVMFAKWFRKFQDARLLPRP
jgi:nucleoside-diphosphate-sugar epimerase